VPIESIKAAKLPLMQSGGTNQATAKSDKSFGQLLSDALDNVNTLQQKAAQASTDLATGKIEDISQVVIAGEKASVALQLTIQVRNKVLESYQEMMRMQV
jgi:flagellar hook-basal body complex protein FliE